MKILLFITGLGMGGAERQVCDLADQYASMGHQVLLISLAGELVNKPKSSEVKVVLLNMKKNPYVFIQTYIKARQLIIGFKPDVVHSHMVHANLFARLLRLSVFIPKLICTSHSSNEGGKLRMLAYRFTDSLCDLNTNVSQEAVNSSVEQGATTADRIIAIHNGIDTSRFIFNRTARVRLRNELGLDDATCLLLAVGRLTAAKDYPNLLIAYELLLKQGCDVHLVIIGSGEEQPMLSTMVMAQGLTERVSFLGLRYDVSDWMSAADVFVLSSAWEGFGLVIAEAMASERVVVATDCGGVKEVIGDAGFLVPPRNSEKLAFALARALQLPPEEKLKIGISARKRVSDKYSLFSVCDKWVNIYRGIPVRLK